MNRLRFLAKSFGDNIDGTKAGVVKLLELLSSGNYKSACIVVPRIGDVKHTILVDVLGDDLFKKLIKERTITFGDEKKLSLCGDATLKNFSREETYLGLWATKDIIAKVEALPAWKALVVVTWVPADAAEWVASNAVTIIYDDGKG